MNTLPEVSEHRQARICTFTPCPFFARKVPHCTPGLHLLLVKVSQSSAPPGRTACATVSTVAPTATQVARPLATLLAG